MGAYGFPDAGLLGQTMSFEYITGGLTAAVATIKPGDLVFSYKGDTKAYGYFADTAKTVFSADFVTSNVINGTVNSVAISPVTFATSHANTMTLLINAVKALAGVEAVLDSTDGTSRTLLIRTKGATTTVDFTVTAGASQATDTNTYASGALFEGVAKYATRVPTTIGGTGLYAIGEEIPVLRLAGVYAASASGLVTGAQAFITTAGIFGTSGVDVGVRAAGDYDSVVVGTNVRLPILPAPMTYGDRF
jgi:hypothetical protein